MSTSSKNDNVFRTLAGTFKLCVVAESYQNTSKNPQFEDDLIKIYQSRNMAKCCEFIAHHYNLSWKRNNNVIVFWKNQTSDSGQIPSISAYDFVNISTSIHTVLKEFLNPDQQKGNQSRRNMTSFLSHLSPQEISAAKTANGLSTKNINKESLRSLTMVLADAAFGGYENEVFQSSMYLRKENNPRLAVQDGILGIEISKNGRTHFRSLQLSELPAEKTISQNLYNDDFPTLQDAVIKLNKIKDIFEYDASLASNPVCLYGEAYASPESAFRNIANLYNLQIKNNGVKSKIKPPVPGSNSDYFKILSSIHALIPYPIVRDCENDTPCIANARKFLNDNRKSLLIWLKQKKTLHQLPILFQTCIAISLSAAFLNDLQQRIKTKSSIVYDRFWDIRIKISRNEKDLVIDALAPNKKTGKLKSFMSWEEINYKAPWEK